MRLIKQCLFMCLVPCSLFAASALADDEQTPTPLPTGALLCPPADQLAKDPHTLTWKAKNGWKSFDKSFSSSVERFLGAQWQGNNVGTIACLYQSDDAMTFPIILRHGSLVYQPKGGKWSKDLGGYANCKSRQQKDCYFIPQVAKKEKGSVYDQASTLQNNSGGEQELGF